MPEGNRFFRVRNVEYVEDYKLKIKFNDNKTKIVDIWPLIKDRKGGVFFAPLRDIEYFKKVAVDQDFITIVWPNEADFDPNMLYEIGTEVQKEKKKAKIPSKPIRRKKKSPSMKYQATPEAKRIAKKTKK